MFGEPKAQGAGIKFKEGVSGMGKANLVRVHSNGWKRGPGGGWGARRGSSDSELEAVWQ